MADTQPRPPDDAPLTTSKDDEKAIQRATDTLVQPKGDTLIGRSVRALAVAVLLGAPAVAIAQSPSPTTAMSPMSPQEYLAKAGASDLFERQSSQVMMNSQKPEIRSFAQMMVRDHAKSTQQVTGAARVAKLKVSTPQLSSKQASDIAALRAAQGAKRDQLYIEQQKAAHREALAVQSNYAENGRIAPLKTAASKIVPVVKHHISMLDAMK